MKESVIQIIEQSRKMDNIPGTDFKFSIAYKPNKESLEVRLWEKDYGLTDTELVTNADNMLIYRIREDAAVEVFRKFYRDVYLTGE